MDKRMDKMKINTENMIRALDNTGISVFVYYPQERKIVIPEKVTEKFQCDSIYTNMPYGFVEKYVYSDDRSGFIEMYEKIHHGENTATTKFRSTNQQICVRDTLTTVAWNENGEPQIVLGVISDETDNFQNELLIQKMQEQLQAESKASDISEATQIIASSISRQYYAIYHIWVESGTYICYTDSREGALSTIGEKGSYEQAIDFYISSYIALEDQDSIREFASLSNVKENLKNHNTYSRTYKQLGVGWTRGTFIAGKRDESGNVTNVIYSVTNINAEVELEEKRKQAAYEAEHDALTGIYNRKGLEKVIKSKKLKEGKVGLIIVDIDNFKSLNDNFGHDIGDHILIGVAEQLTSVFYPKDIIARIGGDEFAILLQDCDVSAWDKICAKLRTIHTILATLFLKPHEISITLSAGITFSDTGYHHEMYQLADYGLYETKRLGRAGCTYIGMDGSVVEHWQDESLSQIARNVLEYNNTGVCQIEISDDPQIPRRLVCSDAAKMILGIPKTFSAEECYKLWRDRIDPSYREALYYTERSMIRHLHTECTFLWNHPEYGTVHLRCGGFGKKEKDKTILSGYCHVLKDTHIIERQNSDILEEGYSSDYSHHQLEKSHALLLTALDASNQLCYEYDPLLHTETCLTDHNFFELPKCIENYPESLRDMDLFYPGDVEIFIQTVHQMDDGADSAQCDVRMKTHGEYIWYSCTFNKYFDPDKERYISILTVFDISLRIASQKTYEARLHSLITVTENTMCMSIVNLTKKTYEVVQCIDSVRPYVNTSLPLEEYLVYASSGIVMEEDRRKFCEMFQVDNLLQQVAKDNLHQEIEYLFKTDESHYEWIYSAIDLIQNPATNEVTGAVYSKSMQTEKIDKMLLGKTLEQDYLFVAAIFVETGEFYLYNYHSDKPVQHMDHFWEIALRNMGRSCSEEVQKELSAIFVKQNILEQLEQQDEYSYAYNGIMNHKMQRLEIRFNYADDAHTMLFASMRNITDVSLLEQYRHDSEHDSLTDLYNRKTLFRKCRELLNTYPNDSFVMLHVDMKHFRLYNTFFGDAAGDKLLCDIGDLFRKLDVDYDYWAYGRIEADVFAVFFPYDEELYHKHVSNIIEILKNYRSDFLIEPTIGMYFVTDTSMSIEAMFTRATLAAKTVRPDTPYATVVFDEEMEKELRDNQSILNEMQMAIDQQQFKVYLQPKYSLRTNQPIGAEALVCWLHPEKGLISPKHFIPVLESNGFITTLDRYVWERTCELLSKWKKNGQPMMPISVNVSRISAYSYDTIPFLKELVRKYDIEPKYLELELTESAYVESPDEIHSRLEELRKCGFKILMDDFGSGYSSLNTLKDLPFDVLKLDMKFLSSSENARGSKILVSVIRMSELLSIPVIMEGVETTAQANYLRSIGCEYVQGYLYARPMPITDFEEKMRDFQDNKKENDWQIQQQSPFLDKVLADITAVPLIDDSISNPLALMGYQNHQLSLMRTNVAFINAFGTRSDLRSANQVIREHLSELDFDKILRAFQKCSETKTSISFEMEWMDEEGLHKYFVNAIYKGYIGKEQVFVVAFIDEQPKNYFV